MNTKLGLILCSLAMGMLIAFASCEQSTKVDLEESFDKVRGVTPISAAQNTTMDLARSSNEDIHFTVTLEDGIPRNGWCIEWNKEYDPGFQKGVELYSTRGREEWKELNYFMSIKDDLLARDPALTYREIQVAIWSLIDNPVFDVDKIAEYDDIDPTIYDNGKPKFDVSKVKELLNTVNTRYKSADSESATSNNFVILVKNEGQTIMVESETAFAYGGNWASCFLEMPNLTTNRWGWTNGPLPEGDYEFDIYAGAAQCDITKGTLVGKLLIDYSGGNVEVTYRMTETSGVTGELYKLTETHLYVGTDQLPKDKKGDYTVSPGQYDHIETHSGITEYTYNLTGFTGDIYVVAHAVVSGFAVEY